jgi:PhzF family phenazine biosynthesis protein
MPLLLYIIDAFTDTPFKGNPAAVCPLESWIDDQAMQLIAAENNLSETAFFVQEGDRFRLRWFTPRVEVSLCGHATLASAFALYEHLGYSGPKIDFDTLSGPLSVTRSEDLLLMDFPAYGTSPVEPPKHLIEGLGIKPLQVLESEDTYMAVYGDEAEIRKLTPDFSRLLEVEANRIIVTAEGVASDFVSRFFAPRMGIDEDPVTGSAHSILIPYWAGKLGKEALFARQLSKRGGELYCRNQDGRVVIGGRAVTYSVGEIQL